MKNVIRVGALSLAVIAATVLVANAYAGPAAPDVPQTIAVPEGNKVFLVGEAVGVQIYACNAIGSGYRWDFLAPRANLYSEQGNLLSTHFGGPSWQARDGSLVVGSVADRAPAEGTIPWLLLEAASTSAGADGDRLAGTTFIQRVATTGGLEPDAAECDAGSAGTTSEVPYTADYYFWKATGA
jgi:hypothetical protein